MSDYSVLSEMRSEKIMVDSILAKNPEKKFKVEFLDSLIDSLKEECNDRHRMINDRVKYITDDPELEDIYRKDINRFWQEIKAFAKVLDKVKNKRDHILYDGK